MESDTKVVKAARRKPPRAGMGRPAGVPNKTTQALKDAILMAAEKSGLDQNGEGGLVGYLLRVANEDVKAFSGLLGRVLPLQINGNLDVKQARVVRIELAPMVIEGAVKNVVGED